MDGRAWLDEVRELYRQHKSLCERAAAQVSDEEFFTVLDGGGNSIAVIMKHLGGNHRSRWRDFLTTDGEKPDRHRDTEFTVEGETRRSVLEKWEEGWRITFESLDSLEPSDLDRGITIRGEPHTVPQAIHRNLMHAAYHTGQIATLARHFAGDSWETLSVAPGESEKHNAAMRDRYGDWWSAEGARGEAP